MAYWLMKSEPEVFGIDHLESRHQALWDGVRNYQARNFMRQMAVGDQALFYHSNCKVPAVVGEMLICKAGYADPTQFDAEHRYYEPKSTLDNPRWTGVDVEFVKKWDTPVTLSTLRTMESLENLALLRRGNRLSLMPLTESEYLAIVSRSKS